MAVDSVTVAFTFEEVLDDVVALCFLVLLLVDRPLLRDLRPCLHLTIVVAIRKIRYQRLRRNMDGGHKGHVRDVL